MPGVLLICIIEGQGPTVLVEGADEDCLDFFPRLSFLFFYLPLPGRRPDIDRNTITKGR